MAGKLKCTKIVRISNILKQLFVHNQPCFLFFSLFSLLMYLGFQWNMLPRSVGKWCNVSSFSLWVFSCGLSDAQSFLLIRPEEETEDFLCAFSTYA